MFGCVSFALGPFAVKGINPLVKMSVAIFGGVEGNEVEFCSGTEVSGTEVSGTYSPGILDVWVMACQMNFYV